MDVRITLHGDKEEPSYNADFEVHFLMALVKKKVSTAIFIQSFFHESIY